VNETLKAVLIALLTTLPAYYLLWSQRRKNLSEADATSAEAAARLNAQTIAMIEAMKKDIAQQEHNTAVLQDKVYLLEQQLKQARSSNYLYKQYINYLIKGSEENRAAIEITGHNPPFVPISLEAFEAAHNA